tara:strand:+ start:768 stop:950 length:183 start_codon:yes stop_codon:yes gene_type:complete
MIEKEYAEEYTIEDVEYLETVMRHFIKLYDELYDFVKENDPKLLTNYIIIKNNQIEGDMS